MNTLNYDYPSMSDLNRVGAMLHQDPTLFPPDADGSIQLSMEAIKQLLRKSHLDNGATEHRTPIDDDYKVNSFTDSNTGGGKKFYDVSDVRYRTS